MAKKAVAFLVLYTILIFIVAILVGVLSDKFIDPSNTIAKATLGPSTSQTKTPSTVPQWPQIGAEAFPVTKWNKFVHLSYNGLLPAALIWQSQLQSICGAPISQSGHTIYFHKNGCSLTTKVLLSKSAPQPTPGPVPTSSPINNNCQQGQGCEQYLVDLINQERFSHHLRPLVMSIKQNACSLSHSQHMASTGNLAHDEFPQDVCIPWTNVGENIGVASSSVYDSINSIHQQMLAEPWVSGCASNHHCNINGGFSTVGVGIYQSGGNVWMTEDFTN